MADQKTVARGAELLRLHQDPSLLTVVNVWDAISAKVVADVDGTKALATASHSIAASLGYEDGENIPVDLMLDAVERIVKATDLPVTADLEGGYGDAAETVRRAIGIGVVGANIEDQMKPLAEAAAPGRGDHEGGRAGGRRLRAQRPHRRLPPAAATATRPTMLADAVERGKAFLDAGAPVVFVPGRLDEDDGPRRWSTPSARSG